MLASVDDGYCCATGDKRKAGQKDLRSAAFSSGPVANARALAEARRSWLAGSTARWGNLGGHWRVQLWRTFGQQQASRLAVSRERLETGDWTWSGRADFTLSASTSTSTSSPTSCLALIHRPSSVRRGCTQVAQYLQRQHRARRFVLWSRREGALCVLQEAPCVWGRCCCWQE